MKGYRVAVVGPLSPFGQRVRALLDQSDQQVLPVTELKLFDGQPNPGSVLTQRPRSWSRRRWIRIFFPHST